MKLLNKNPIRTAVPFRGKSGSPNEKMTQTIGVSNNILDKRSNTNISFKGVASLSSYEALFKNHDDLMKIAKRELGSVASDLYKKIKTGDNLKKAFVYENGVPTKLKEHNPARLLLEYATFPFVKMPLLITDSVLKNAEKIGFLSKGAKSLRESPVLKTIRQNDELASDINKFQGIISQTAAAVHKHCESTGATIADILESKENPKIVKEKLLDTVGAYFDPKTGNYNTAHERSLNRVVTGLASATFLGFDAYNLSVLCGDKKEVSQKEQKKRVKQEVVRVLSTSFMSLISLGALSKYTNKSIPVSSAVAAVPVLLSETISRGLSGNPLLFISPEKAKEINKKRAEKNKSDVKNDSAQPVVAQPSNGSSAVKFKANEKKSETKDQKNKAEQKTLISFKTLKKWTLGLALGGFALSSLRNNKNLNSQLKYSFPKLFEDNPKKMLIKDSMDKFSNFWKKQVYEKSLTKEYALKHEEYGRVLEKLEESGFEAFAQKLETIGGKRQNTGIVDLKVKNKYDVIGKTEEMIQIRQSRKIKPFVDVLIEPFKFTWSVIRLPFKLSKMVVNLPASSIQSKIDANPKFKPSLKQNRILEFSENLFGPAAGKSKTSPEQMFVNTMNKLTSKLKELESGKIDEKNFKKYINNAVLAKFSPQQSSIKNTELANLTKIVASTITSSFLIADNYNMVMLKSNGENKADAKEKAKERVVQRISSMFFQVLCMNLFNNTFQKRYHSSLLGMASVSGPSQMTMELFTRSSVGMPVGPKSYDEMVELDEKNMKRKGFAGAYFKFMSKLTGKKPLQKKVPETAAPTSKPPVAASKKDTTNLLELAMAK